MTTDLQRLAEKIAEVSFKFWNDGDTPTSWDGCEPLFDSIESLLSEAIEKRENCVACTLAGMKTAYTRAAEVVRTHIWWNYCAPMPLHNNYRAQIAAAIERLREEKD